MATRRMARDESDAVLRVSDELSARLVHRDYRARPSRQWSLVEVGGPSLRLVLTIGEAERLRDALEVLLRQVPHVEAVPLFGQEAGDTRARVSPHPPRTARRGWPQLSGAQKNPRSDPGLWRHDEPAALDTPDSRALLHRIHAQA